MRDLVSKQQLLLKTGQHRRVRSQLRPDDFQRDEAIEFTVGGLVHRSHAALTEQLQNFISSTDQLADLKYGGAVGHTGHAAG